jgi:hypothetical protein
MHTINGIIVVNRERFDELKTQVDFGLDHISVQWVEDDERCHIESWGEHGPKDFDKWGFRVLYRRDADYDSLSIHAED